MGVAVDDHRLPRLIYKTDWFSVSPSIWQRVFDNLRPQYSYINGVYPVEVLK